MYDIFISYRRDGGYLMARLLYDRLVQMGARVFFDMEELRSGTFNTKLYTSIEDSANFLLILPKHALDRCDDESDWLRLEIQHAMSSPNGINIVPVMMSDFEWPDSLPQSIADLRNYNGVRVRQEYFDASVTRIVEMLVNVNLNSAKNVTKYGTAERLENTYFYFEDEKEKRRLRIQQDLVKGFDAATYCKAIEAFDELRILDIGSNNGDMIMDRIGKNEKVRLLVGLEYDVNSVKQANERYGQNGKISFYNKNVEDDDLCEYLQQVLEQMGAERFNILNISMVLLHLKNPYRLLKAVRKVLDRNALIIIRDIDDGFNIAYPDENGYFARAVKICASTDTSGYRLSGRQIFTLLRHAGYADVTVENMGLSTVGMSYDERSALFDTYFSFIMEDLKIMHERYPDNAQVENDYKWYQKIYEDLEERFQDDAFYFNLGFVLYTARKH